MYICPFIHIYEHIQDLVGSLLTALSGALKPLFVVKRMKVVMDKSKAPLAHQYYLEWLKEAIAEFGMDTCIFMDI